MGDIGLSSDWLIGNKIFSLFLYVFRLCFHLFYFICDIWTDWSSSALELIYTEAWKHDNKVILQNRALHSLLFTKTASPAKQDNAREGANGLSSSSEKNRTSNHFQMSLQRQYILHSYFKTISGAGAWTSISRKAIRRSTTWSKHEQTKSGYSFLELISLLFNSATRLRKYSSKIKQVQYLTEFILTTEDRSLIVTRRSFTE